VSDVPPAVPSSSSLPPTTPSAPRAMASGGEQPARNGKPESGVRERPERDRERERGERGEREREREWVPRESAQQQQQQHQHHRERDRERDREPAPPVLHHPRDIVPPGGGGGSNASSNNNNAAALPQPQPPLTPLAETGSGSFLSRIGGPYRSPPTASNSFRSDVGEQRSWPEDDWDGTRKRTLSGEPFFFFSSRRNGT